MYVVQEREEGSNNKWRAIHDICTHLYVCFYICVSAQKEEKTIVRETAIGIYVSMSVKPITDGEPYKVQARGGSSRY